MSTHTPSAAVFYWYPGDGTRQGPYLKRAEYAWPDSFGEGEDFDRLLEMLPWMTRLRWMLEYDYVARDAKKRQWALLLSALEEMASSVQRLRRRYEQNEIELYIEMRALLPITLAGFSTTSRYGCAIGQGARLQEFELHDHLDNERLMLLLPLLPCLTKLKLSINQLEGGPLRLERILRDCPHLEHLCVRNPAGWGRTHWEDSLPGPWVFSQPQSGAFSYVTTSPLALKSLVIYGMSLSQSTLHDLLDYTPRLKEINITSVELLDVRAFDFAAFNKRIQGLPLRLEYFHFSSRDVPHDGITSEICPNPHQRTIGSCDFTPAILKSLSLQPNTITTLELFYRDNSGDHPRFDPTEFVLHNYLCSSPQLLHLKALHYEYLIDHMDLQGRIAEVLFGEVRRRRHFTYTEWKPNPPGIWACRRLRTLHLRIITPERTIRQMEPRSDYGRVAFGYIARVCPDLRDLALGNGSGYSGTSPTPLDIQLQGGFCLLAQLKHLERIEIGRFYECSALTPQNFEWMFETGRTAEKRSERQAHLKATWKRLRLWDHVLETFTAATAAATAAVADADADSITLNTDEDNTTDRIHFDWTAVDPALREELRYLGWPIEVQAFFDELDKSTDDGGGGGGGRGRGRFHCFPALRYLCICSMSGFDMSPEEDYKRFIILSRPRTYTILH
ncbi:hypothetical protein BGX24_008908 [Mortierella sp. AD032]|nr:hypothetical protein BGX24_008908 [Mortierella sp. AD032]